jgi:hypothetical protein
MYLNVTKPIIKLGMRRSDRMRDRAAYPFTTHCNLSKVLGFESGAGPEILPFCHEFGRKFSLQVETLYLDNSSPFAAAHP